MDNLKKGVNRGNAGKGRPKGSINKENKALREMILQALDEQEGGGVAYLKEQAQKSPASFLTLLGKVLPTTLAGDPDHPILTKVVREIVRPQDSNSGGL